MITGGGYGTFRGIGPEDKPSISGLAGVNIIAIGGSLAKGLVLAANFQTVQVGGKFKGGPYPDATFPSKDGDVKVSQKATAVASQIGALVDWYPFESNGFHAAVGAGFNQTIVTIQADDSVLSGVGGAGTFLVGYDWPISRTFAVGVTLVGTVSTSSSLKYSEAKDSSGYELSNKSIGVGISLLYF